MREIVRNNLLLLRSRFVPLILLPLILCLVGYIVFSPRDSVSNPSIGWVDLDRTELSEFLKQSLEEEGFDLVVMEKLMEEATFDTDSVANEQPVISVIQVERGYQDAVMNNGQPRLTIQSEGLSEMSGLVKSYINTTTGSWIDAQKLAKTESPKELISLWTDPNLASIQVEREAVEAYPRPLLSNIIGFYLYLLIFNIFSVSKLILKERAWNTYARIIRSPISPSSYITANICVGIIILFVNLLGIYGIATLMGQAEQLFSMMLVVFLYGLSVIALGILVMITSKNTNVADLMTTLIATPIAMISGAFWPVDFMPESLQLISKLSPMRWTLEILKDLDRGKTLMDNLMPIGILFGFVVVFFLITLFALRKTDAVEQFV